MPRLHRILMSWFFLVFSGLPLPVDVEFSVLCHLSAPAGPPGVRIVWRAGSMANDIVALRRKLVVEKDFLQKLYNSANGANKLLAHASTQQYYVLSRIFHHILGGRIKISRSVLANLKSKRKLSFLGDHFQSLDRFDSLPRADQYTVLKKLSPVLKSLLSPLFPKKWLCIFIQKGHSPDLVAIVGQAQALGKGELYPARAQRLGRILWK